MALDGSYRRFQTGRTTTSAWRPFRGDSPLILGDVIDDVEQLTRYLELLNRDPLLASVKGIFAAQQIKPQAKVLAEDRGIRRVTLDYEVPKGTDANEFRLF